MALNQTYKKSEYFLVPEDAHIAKLYSIVDVGDHETGFRREGVDEDGQKTDLGPVIQTKMIVTFELQDQIMADGRPAAISTTITASLNEKSTFHKMAVALLGGKSDAKEFIETEGRTVGEVADAVIGKAALLTVVHAKVKDKTGSERVYANIGTVSALPSKDVKSLTPVVNPQIVVKDCNEVDAETRNKIPAFILKKMGMRLNNLNRDQEAY